MLKINDDNCIGCKVCENVCPYGAIIVDSDEKKAKVLDNCTLCGTCVNVCKYDALIIKRKTLSREELEEYEGIMIWGELEKRGNEENLKIKNVVFELLGKAQELNKILNETISVVILGSPGKIPPIDELYHCGADNVYLCEHNLLENYTTDGYATTITTLIINQKPSIFLYGATINGRDLAPRIAARLGLGLTADCTGFEINEKKQLVQIRPAFGGNIMASIISPFTRPQMATVRPNNFPIPIKDSSRKGEFYKFEVKIEKQTIRTKIIEEKIFEIDTISIEEAEILVSAGRGIGNKENLKLVRELAREIKGIMSSSRALVELGWTSHPIQVGQSGKTVSPKLYVALGISGAIQHLIGMQTSDVIIAINTDPEASIFKIADFGIVGDIFEVVPQLLKQLRTNRIKNF
ncbi:MAG: FAD-binding protein [Candidatus Hodarchaeota archaeon]